MFKKVRGVSIPIVKMFLLLTRYHYWLDNIIYLQMVCQKLCRNSVSRWGSLEESTCFPNIEHVEHGIQTSKNRSRTQCSPHFGGASDFRFSEVLIIDAKNHKKHQRLSPAKETLCEFQKPFGWWCPRYVFWVINTVRKI